jgi:hypothetical protein
MTTPEHRHMPNSYDPSLVDQGYGPEDSQPDKRCETCGHSWSKHRNLDGCCSVQRCTCGMTQCQGCGMWVVLAGNPQGVCPKYPACRAEVDVW